MAEEKPAEVTPAAAVDDPLGLLRHSAPWLFAPDLGVCLVGSHALGVACRRAGQPGPRPVDLDLAWAPSLADGASLLQLHGVLVPTTTGNQQRGTLAMKVGRHRVEITTFRGSEERAPLAKRIAADLAERDMTIGAVAIELANDRCHDPHGGMQHWQQRRIVPVGDAIARVREHPVRWLRYYRKAHELGFTLDASIRSLDLEPCVMHALPREAVAGELRAVLGKCSSPGRCLLDLHEARLLGAISPELALQFDGRPAGPQRWHPEVSQALHLILALEWAAANTRDLDERDRMSVLVAVLCHDLGKGYTPAGDLPQHAGHEHGGLPHVDRLVERWPGLTDHRGAMLARHVCALHLVIRQFPDLRPGTLAKLYDEHFRAKDYPVDLFARAIAADVAGRLGHAAAGEPARARVAADLHWLREVTAEVDAAALRAEHGDDLDAFRTALHEARARAIAKARAER